MIQNFHRLASPSGGTVLAVSLYAQQAPPTPLRWEGLYFGRRYEPLSTGRREVACVWMNLEGAQQEQVHLYTGATKSSRGADLGRNKSLAHCLGKATSQNYTILGVSGWAGRAQISRLLPLSHTLSLILRRRRRDSGTSSVTAAHSVVLC